MRLSRAQLPCLLKPIVQAFSPSRLRVGCVALMCALTATLVLAQKPLVYNNYYNCGGTRIVVLTCTLGTVENDYNDCIVQYPDRPNLPNGQKPARSILRRDLIKIIQTCTLLGPVTAATDHGGPTTGGRPGGTAPSESLLDRIVAPILGMIRTVLALSNAFGGIFTWVFWIVVIWLAAKIIRKIMGTDKSGGKEATGSQLFARDWKKDNEQALQFFGPTQQMRTARIDEVFDRRQATIKAVLIDTQQGLRVEMGRSLATMPLREVEALRTVYHLANLEMEQYNNFYIARVCIVYADGKGMQYGESQYGVVESFETYMTGYKLDAGVNIALQDLMIAIGKNPNEPTLSKLKDRLFGTGSDLAPAAPLKGAENGAAVGNGLILGLDDKSQNKVWYYDGEGSLITVAPTRSGKTEGQVYPNVLRFKGPAIILDIKGEIYSKTSKWRQENVGPIFRFSPLDPNRGHCYNPLTAVRCEPEFLWTDARVLADLMISPSDGSGSGNSKFFEEAARDIIHAAVAYVCLEKDVTKRPMSKVLDIVHGLGWNQFITYLQGRIDMPSMARAGASFSQTLTPEVRGSVLQTAQRSLSAWMGDLPERATSKSDWQPSDFRSGKNPTLYICIGLADMKSYRSLLRTIIGQHINVLTNGEPPKRTNPPAPPILFLLDELPQLKNMPPIEEALVVGAGYGVKLWMFVQDVGQLKKEYPNADGMISNCAVRMYMNPDLGDGTAQKLSEDIGYRESILDGNRVKVVEPNVLAGPDFQDKVLVWARGMARPAALRKNFAYKDATLASRMQMGGV